MRKGALAAVAALGVVVVGATGALAFSVGRAAERLSEPPKQLAQLFPFVRVARSEVSRGLFTADHALTLRLGCVPAVDGKGAPTPLEVQLKQHVRSGALVDGTLAVIDTELVLPDSAQGVIAGIFARPDPVALETRALLSGELVSSLTIAPAKVDDPAQGGFEIGPVQLTVRVRDGAAAGSTHVRYEHPAIELRSHAQGADLRMHLGRGQGETVFGARPDPTLWLAPSTASYELASLGFDLGVALPGATPVPPVHAEFERARFTQETSVADGRYGSQGSMDLRGKVADVKLDAVLVKSRMERIALAPYQRLLQSVLARALSCEPAAASDTAALLKELTSAIGEILVGDPALAMDPLRVVVDGKTAELGLEFGTRGVVASDIDGPATAWLLQKGYAKLHVGVDRALIEQAAAFALAAQSGAAAGNPAPGNALAAKMLVEQGVAGGVAAGYLEQQGERIAATLAFERGEPLLNGKPLPPELLSDLLGAAGSAGVPLPSAGP